MATGDRRGEVDQGWQRVSRRGEGSLNGRRVPLNDRYVGSRSFSMGSFSKNPNPRSVYRDLKSVSTSFFITNFPPLISVSELWKRFNEWGTVVDVFVSKRRSSAGKPFGFVRFVKVADNHVMVGNLRTMWFGNYHLFADVVRTDRTQKGSGTNIDQHTSNHEASLHSVGDKPSFKDVLAGSPAMATADIADSGTEAPCLNNVSNKIVTLEEEECIEDLNMDQCLLAKVRNVDSIRSLFHLIRAEGFAEVGIRYLGGRWVWI